MTNEANSHASLTKGTESPTLAVPRRVSGSTFGHPEKPQAKAESPAEEIDRRDSGSTAALKSALPNVDAWDGDVPSQICLCQPDPKVPRPRNAFILYRQHHQASFVAQNPGLPNPEISKVIGDHWRASPPEVKEHWKLLAEEEKIRHQKQYPDYRYQPRRTGRAGSLVDPNNSAGSSVAEGSRCVKCGGKSINSTSVMGTSASMSSQGSPPLPQPNKRDYGYSMGPPPLATSGSTTGRFAKALGSPPGRDSAMQNYHFARPQTAHALPLVSPRQTKRAPDGAVSPGSPDHKRRRIPFGTFDQVRGPQGPQTPFALSHPHQRRPSLPRPDFMGSNVPGSSAIGLPPRQIDSSLRSRADSLRLPPLHTSTAIGSQIRDGTIDAQQAKTLEAMISTIPYLTKIRILGKYSGPLPISPLSTSPFSYERRKGRGPVIAIDSVNGIAVTQVQDALEKALKDEYDLQIFPTPPMPQSGFLTMKDFLHSIDQYHELSESIVAHVCPTKSMDSGSTETASTPRKLSRVGHQLSHVEIKSTSDHKDQAMDVSGSPISPKSFPKSAGASPNPGADQETAAEEEETAVEYRKLPIAILPGWQLTNTDFFAINTPIKDAYSPVEHWQWHAALWRGIVGADATLAIETAHSDDSTNSPPNTATSGINGATPSLSFIDASIQNKKAIDGTKGAVRAGNGLDLRLDDSRAVIIQGGENGLVGEGILRRIGFEVGEWVRCWHEDKDAM